jgi:uncharacterized lipoprotein
MVLAGCSTISTIDQSDSYKKTKPHRKPLLLPSHIDRTIIKNKYEVPKATHCKHASADALIVPPGCKL